MTKKKLRPKINKNGAFILENNQSIQIDNCFATIVKVTTENGKGGIYDKA